MQNRQTEGCWDVSLTPPVTCLQGQVKSNTLDFILSKRELGSSLFLLQIIFVTFLFSDALWDCSQVKYVPRLKALKNTEL